ncbi:MAG TPA: aldolase/citrate lyase family protein [Thermodesulfobacteriota bacterium]
MANRVKALLRRGEPAVGHWLSFPSPDVAELLAGFGMDWMLVDTEHGPASYADVENVIRAIAPHGVVPMVRVGENNAALIKRALDRGAAGVLVPMVNTAEEAAAAVAACRFPPEGIRGIAGTRASRYGLDAKRYFDEWNEDALVVVQVETREAVENVERIAAVPGVDVLFIGPNDLSASLGGYLQFDRPEFTSAVSRIVAAAKAHGKAVGYLTTGADAALARIRDGVTFIAVVTDSKLLADAAAATYRKVREAI